MQNQQQKLQGWRIRTFDFDSPSTAGAAQAGPSAPTRLDLNMTVFPREVKALEKLRSELDAILATARCRAEGSAVKPHLPL